METLFELVREKLAFLEVMPKQACERCRRRNNEVEMKADLTRMQSLFLFSDSGVIRRVVENRRELISRNSLFYFYFQLFRNSLT